MCIYTCGWSNESEHSSNKVNNSGKWKMRWNENHNVNSNIVGCVKDVNNIKHDNMYMGTVSVNVNYGIGWNCSYMCFVWV